MGRTLKYILNPNKRKQKINQIINKLERKLKAKRLRSLPIYLDIVPTKRCNIKCIFCIKYDSGETMDMSMDTFKIIVKKLFPYPLSANFCSGGEPFLNKNLLRMLQVCKDYAVNTYVLSNGMLLTQKIIEQIVKNGLIDSLGISFDGAEKKTVEGIRVGVNHEKVLENIGSIVESKKRYNKKIPNISFACCLMRRNIEELPKLIEMAAKIGIGKVFCQYLAVANDIDEKESLFFHPDLAKKYFDLAKGIAEKLNIELQLPSEINKNLNTTKFCYEPWSFMMIDTDGRIIPCYKGWDAISMGNITACNSIYEIWNSKKYRKFRTTVNSSAPYFHYCNICSNRKGFNRVESHLVRRYWEDKK